MKFNVEGIQSQEATYNETAQEYYGVSCSSYFPDSIRIAEELSVVRGEYPPLGAWHMQSRCRYCTTKNMQNGVYCIGCGAPL